MPRQGSALALWGRVVAIIIQAGFTNGDHLRCPRELGDHVEVRICCFRDGVGMDADAGRRPWHPTRQLDGGATAGQVVADQHHRSHARCSGAGQDGIPISIESWIH